MQRYNWANLKKEYVLSDCRSIKSFLESKGMQYNGNAKKKTQGWSEIKVKKEEQKSVKIIEKVINKTAEEEAKKIIKVNDVANSLLAKLMEATNELNTTPDMFGNTHEGIVDRNSIKKLTSALKDISEILDGRESGDGSFASEIEKAWRTRNDK